MTYAMPLEFFSGAIFAGFLVLGLFFLRFWRRTRDSFFAMFAAAFWLLALNQVAFTFSRSAGEERGWVFLIRLAAFLLIIAAIIRKNTRTARGP